MVVKDHKVAEYFTDHNLVQLKLFVRSIDRYDMI